MKTIKLYFAVAALSCVSLQAQAYAPAGETIRTKWAAEVSPENARPEYPRPQMVRKDWVNLNGLWDYAIAKADIASMPEVQGQILVPFCVESSLSGVGKRVEADEALWYRTTLTSPEKWSGRRVLLHFDAVDWQCEVFINGEAVTTHKGGYTGFEVDVTEYLVEGEATLELKVTDPTDDDTHPVPRGKQYREPHGIWYTPVTGIWQTVWMEAVPEKAYIDDYNVVANIVDGTFTVTTDLVGAEEGDEIQVVALRPRIGYSAENPGWAIFGKGRAKGPAGEPLTVKVRRPKMWTVDKPYLYGLRISLIRNGKVIDRVQGYSALRQVTVQKDEFGVKRLALNGEILFQFGPLDQGWWPDGLYTAPTAEAMAWDIERTKELGFNMIRKHIKVEPSRWYYDCDRLGMMVWQDMPCIGDYKRHDRADWAQGVDVYGAGRDYYALTPEAAAGYYAEWGDILHKFAKFPSIVVWVPFNEAWGQFDTKAVCEFTREKDPTRLINAASGGNWIEGAGDILDSHHYPGPRMRLLDTAMVNVLGEYGGIGYPIEGHLWQEGKNWGYVKFQSTDEVTDKYVEFAKALEGLVKTDMCAAAVYTQTTDVEGEVNGFYTYDREVLKMDLGRVREANTHVINTKSDVKMIPEVDFYNKDVDGGKTALYTIENGGITMQITNFGARVISLFAPDRDGRRDDIIVGYDKLERYVHNTGERFLGATVGRVANRICKGRMTVDGKTYTLPINNDPNCLHGGFKGIDMVVWDVVEHTDTLLTLHYLAPDGQDGFPGNLDITLTFALTGEGALDLQYKATTDKTTPVNLSQHAFFNLKGTQGGTILDHNMTIYADAITPVDATLIPTGEFMDVEGTPFDFRTAHKIGERVLADHEQLRFGNGYDHNWVLNGSDGTLRKVCEFSEDSTGRLVEIYTDQPGLQFYCGNFFDGSYCGKTEGQPIGFREAIALETQKFPDSVNQPAFPSTLLTPGEVYTQHTVYRFTTK